MSLGDSNVLFTNNDYSSQVRTYLVKFRMTMVYILSNKYSYELLYVAGRLLQHVMRILVINILKLTQVHWQLLLLPTQLSS